MQQDVVNYICMKLNLFLRHGELIFNVTWIILCMKTFTFLTLKLFTKHDQLICGCCQERYTCTRLRMHPSEAQFVSQTQGGYIALFSTIKPYKMNKCKRFDAHQVCSVHVVSIPAVMLFCLG